MAGTRAVDEEVGEGRGKGSDLPDVGGDEDDDGEGAEPCVSDGDDNVARHGGAGEVAERDDDHAQRQGQRYQVEHPHLAAPTLSANPLGRRGGRRERKSRWSRAGWEPEASPCRRRAGGEVGPGRSRGSFVSGEVEKRARLGEGGGTWRWAEHGSRSAEFGNVGPRGVLTRTQRLSSVLDERISTSVDRLNFPPRSLFVDLKIIL